MGVAMKILHLGSHSSPHVVDGVNTTIWLVAREQALLGHEVTLLLDSPPNEAAKTLAEAVGIKLISISANNWYYDTKTFKSLLHTDTPQIVHMHSVFIPTQASFAKNLVQDKIPYVITPHGGLDSQRSQAKKILYSLFIEKKRFSQASAITVVTPKEEKTVRAFVPSYQGKVSWVANPFDSHKLMNYKWKGNVEAKKLVFLGRFDVLHKGLDILVKIAQFLPEVEFHLYGNEELKTIKKLTNLQRNSPPNVYFHKPVFNEEKLQVLANASLYIQTSRWEGFPVSIVEAMSLGVPCAVTEMPNFAELFRQHDLGLLLSANPQVSADRLRAALSQPAMLHNWSKRAEEFARKQFEPREVALGYLNVYNSIVFAKNNP
ncbi:hypothetical protein B4U84_05760 [Westiellopsis prolifica IICB1]|nr:hypothetical protein B4U84_05760 [Westiellopsis prolifica IICB1]